MPKRKTKRPLAPSKNRRTPTPKNPPKSLPDTGSFREVAQRLRNFGRDFTQGLDRRELERLFEEDAFRAWSLLSQRDRSARSGESPRESLVELLQEARAFFLGVSFKLSPARRLLFAGALLLPLLGIIDLNIEVGANRLFIDSSPIWFLASIASLTLLLALELVDRLRVRDELEVARQLQRDLLPRQSPVLPGYRFAHSYRTANEIGGDYYDFLLLEDGRWVITVGDASGHGMAAGLLMAIANSGLKTAVDLDPEPTSVMRLLNRVLHRSGGRRAFMTLFYGLLDPSTGVLDFASAGHPFPLLRRANGEIEELGEGAFPLGIRQDTEVQSHQVTLEPGDLLAIFSDGLPEANRGIDHDSFGFERLRSFLQPNESARDVHDRILKEVDCHLDGRSLHDDLTLVVFDRAPLPPQVPKGHPPQSALRRTGSQMPKPTG